MIRSDPLGPQQYQRPGPKTSDPIQKLRLNVPTADHSDKSDKAQSPLSAPHIKKLMSQTPEAKRPPPSINTSFKIRRFIDKFFMLLCLAIIIPISFYHPIGHDDGPLNPSLTSSWIATISLFFFMSLGMKLEYITKIFAFWQCNIFTHFVTFVYYPLVGLLIYQAALTVPHDIVSQDMHALLEGIIILCCLPATGASSVAFTTNAGGNEGAAAITCTISIFLGIFLSPIMIIWLIGEETFIDKEDIAYQLSLKAVAPFFAAQFIRLMVGEHGRIRLKRSKIIIKKINEIALLYIVFCVLSESFYLGIYPSITDLCVFLLLIILLHCHGYLALWILSGCFRGCLLNKSKSCFLAFTIYDRVACIYSGVSKCIVIGIPLIKTMYSHDHIVAMYILPILCYYPTNLIIGSLMIENLRKLTMKEKRFLSTYTSTFTELSLGTDYGALSPFKIDHDNAYAFSPFALAIPNKQKEQKLLTKTTSSHYLYATTGTDV